MPKKICSKTPATKLDVRRILMTAAGALTMNSTADLENKLIAILCKECPIGFCGGSIARCSTVKKIVRVVRKHHKGGALK